MYNHELYHFGVKGMKWGVRKKRIPKSEDHVRAKALKKKKISQMSNAELRELNTRMQLESQYKSLNKRKLSAGEKFVKEVAYESAKSIASEYTKKYAKKGIAYLGDSLKTEAFWKD